MSDLSRTKASDWIKQIARESLDSSRGCDVSHLHDTTMRTPYHGDSVKRSKGKKLVPGGMAEQLQRVVQREASEITFWEHKAKKLEEKDIGMHCCHCCKRLEEQSAVILDTGCSRTVSSVSPIGGYRVLPPPPPPPPSPPPFLA